MLHAVSIWALVLPAITFLVLVSDVGRHPRKMKVMNFVWPVTAVHRGFAAAGKKRDVSPD